MIQMQRDNQGRCINLNQERSIKVSGEEVLEMGLANKFGQMEQFMKEIGKTIELTVKENLLILMVIFTKETGLTIRLMAKVFTSI